MQPLIHTLDRVRRRTRLLLVVRRGAMWLTGALAAIMLAALSDYALRFPGGLRLAILCIGAAVAAYYFVRLIGRAVRVNPSLSTLALRLERLYPAAAGRLASAVAFATEGSLSATSRLTADLARRTTEQAQGVVDEHEIRRLINPRPVVRCVAGFVMILLVMTSVAVAAPHSFHIAVQRWTQPFGEARWPNRYRVESLTDRAVAANNAPIPFAAQVQQGDHPHLRTWLVYRFTRDGRPTGDWQRVLMTRQNEQGLYERPLEPQPGATGIEFYFEAGDDATLRGSMQLIQPPTLTMLTAQVAPPEYAAGVLTGDRHDLLQPPRPSVTIEALEGSRIELQLSVEGSFTALAAEPAPQQLRDWLEATFIGLLDEADAAAFAEMHASYGLIEPSAVESARQATVTFALGLDLLRPMKFRLNFADAYGSRYEDPRLFIFEVRPDRPPRVAVTAPRGDESVLATAALPVAAEAHDDVAVQRLDLEARVKERPAVELSSEAGGRGRARVDAKLDLAPLKLKPGDEVGLVGIARDNFRLAERVHDPVESPPRLLRIISEQDLSRQLHSDLADLRQRALRAQAAQQQLLQAPATPSTVQQQQDLTQRIEQMSQVVAQVQERAAINRLDDERLAGTLRESRDLLRQAGESSDQASSRLSAAAADPQQAPALTEQARPPQQQAAQKLKELAELLDQGREAYELRQKLIKLVREQESLGDSVRQLLPRTLGRELDQLTAEQKRDLAENARRQSELARDANELTQRMRSTAAAISRQSEDADQQAMAEALRQASETATSQNLDEKMEQASQQVDRNQLADARQSQDQAQQTLRQMLEQIDRAEQLKQQILRRKLAELVESIRRLRDQQKAQLDRLLAAQHYEGLDAPMLTLRRNTLSVSETARATDPQAGPVADQLDAAANHQGDAIRELRAAAVDPAAAQAAEAASLASLEAALKLAQELSRKAQQQLTEDERRKLIEQYTQALELQKAVHGETQQLTQAVEPERNRRWRAEALKTGKRQEEVLEALKALREKIAQTIVYATVHEQTERWVEQAAGELAEARPSAATVFQQEMAIASIESLIEALKEDKPDDEQFAEGDSGGGGGGQGAGPQPLIPPVAELKLLKARQVTVHNITRALEQATDGQVQARILQEAAAQQQSLAESGDRLLEAISQQQRQPQPRIVEPED